MKEYRAKAFYAATVPGEFIASGTLCGHVDFRIPRWEKSLPLTPREAREVAAALLKSAEDVEAGANPDFDRRLYAGSADRRRRAN